MLGHEPPEFFRRLMGPGHEVRSGPLQRARHGGSIWQRVKGAGRIGENPQKIIPHRRVARVPAITAALFLKLIVGGDLPKDRPDHILRGLGMQCPQREI